MEYHDKMKSFRKRRVGSIIVFSCLLILWISLIIIKRDIYQFFLVPGLIIGCIVGCFIFILLIFEYYRPDFIITNKSITFSNLGVATLIRKKDFIHLVPIPNIVEILDLDDRMGFEIDGDIKYVVIIKDQFDDYSIIRTNIIELAKRYNIKILS